MSSASTRVGHNRISPQSLLQIITTKALTESSKLDSSDNQASLQNMCPSRESCSLRTITFYVGLSQFLPLRCLEVITRCWQLTPSILSKIKHEFHSTTCLIFTPSRRFQDSNKTSETTLNSPVTYCHHWHLLDL